MKPSADDLDRIQERAQGFDVVALELLLRYFEYDRSRIQYLAHFGATPRAALVESIAFGETVPARMNALVDAWRPLAQPSNVDVEVNLGLLSNRSPLPSYFRDLLADREYQGPLVKLLDVLDDTLIAERIASFRPEWDERLAPGWDGTRQDLLRLTSLTTPSTLHAVFQLVFPELGVAVRRAPARRPMIAPSVVLGCTSLGEATFGGEAEVTVPGLEITLICRDVEAYAGVPWLDEAQTRLTAQVLPLLDGTMVHLTVIVLSYERGRDAQFDDRSHVGENPLPGGDPGLRRTVIFSGSAPPRASFELADALANERPDDETTRGPRWAR